MKTKTLSLLLGALMILNIASCKKADLTTEKGKYSYAMGYDFGSSMKANQVDLDVDTFMAAVEEALKDKKSSLSERETRQVMMNLQMNVQAKMMKKAEDNKAKGDQFLMENKVKDGVKTTASGLQYRVIKEGTGRKPKANSLVTVHYTGKLIDGTEFDSSYKNNQPVQFMLNQVIKGWSEGLQLMTPGSKYELFIPSDIGYGPRGNQKIPGGSVLIFEVELVSIDK